MRLECVFAVTTGLSRYIFRSSLGKHASSYPSDKTTFWIFTQTRVWSPRIAAAVSMQLKVAHTTNNYSMTERIDIPRSPCYESRMMIEIEAGALGEGGKLTYKSAARLIWLQTSLHPATPPTPFQQIKLPPWKRWNQRCWWTGQDKTVKAAESRYKLFVQAETNWAMRKLFIGSNWTFILCPL